VIEPAISLCTKLLSAKQEALWRYFQTLSSEGSAANLTYLTSYGISQLPEEQFNRNHELNQPITDKFFQLINNPQQKNDIFPN
jgi:hypothetical protein